MANLLNKLRYKKRISEGLSYIGLKPLLLSIRYAVLLRVNRLFNTTMKRQTENPKRIPIIIISFNQLLYLRRLIDFLRSNGYSNIVIIDNNSTFEPLLKYLDQIECHVTIYRLRENEGHRVFWKKKELFKKYSMGYYAVTDPDVVPVPQCPENFMAVFRSILDEKSEVAKVGFSLKIDNLPDTNKNKEVILKWENQFWQRTDIEGNYIAKIDTTFALYRPRYIPPVTGSFFNAIRVRYPFTAIHGGWYIDSDNLTEEQDHYVKNVSRSSSWFSFKEDGKLLKYRE